MGRFMAGILGAFGLITSAQAALQPPLNGQVYDDVLGINWLQDANMVKTLCDAGHPLWNSFDPSLIPNNSYRDKTTICDTDEGRLNWYEADGWIAHLNANGYLGQNDWRQLAAGQPDATCSHQTTGAPPPPSRLWLSLRGQRTGPPV